MLITTFDEGGEVQPNWLVTLKVCVPAGTPVTVVEVPDPPISDILYDGSKVQLPEGNPVNTTLPVGTAQVGCVIVPGCGAVGVGGGSGIATLSDGNDVQPY